MKLPRSSPAHEPTLQLQDRFGKDLLVFSSVNPSTGEELGSYELYSDKDVDTRLEKALRAYRNELGAPASERASRMRALAVLVSQERETFAQMAVAEMGKPIRDARAELGKCVAVLEHYAETAPALLADSVRPGALVTYQPLGPILAIMPWNFPFWQVFRVLAPAIAVGNPLLLKHAENVLGCAALIEDVVHAAGLPEGTLQSLVISTDQVAPLLSDDRVQGVTLTGSVRAGRAVAEIAGRYGKKSVLELGGSDPFLVLEDADAELAAVTAARSRLFNSGQACIAAKRFIVHRSLRDEFVERVAGEFEKAVVGSPLDEATTIGPIARLDLLENLERQVAETLEQGASTRVGGGREEGPGFFYTPTLLADVNPDFTAGHEETFGPVGAVITADSDEDALRIANDTPYGLGACICTSDPERALAVAKALEVGNVAINAIVASRPDLPFGGVKASGYGRELGTEALREFTNIKTVLTE